MVQRSSSRILMALVAALGIALGAACNKQVSAQEPKGDQVDETRAGPHERVPTNGGPVDVEEQSTSPATSGAAESGAAESGEVSDESGVPDPTGNPRQDDADEQLDGPSPSDTDAPHQAAPPEDDEESDEENWHAPVRGSGGDNPPDFIDTSEPKTV